MSDFVLSRFRVVLVRLSGLTVVSVSRRVPRPILSYLLRVSRRTFLGRVLTVTLVTGPVPRPIDPAIREVFSGLMRLLELATDLRVLREEALGEVLRTEDLRVLLRAPVVLGVVRDESTRTSVRR